MCLNHFHHRYVEKEPSDGRVRPVCDNYLAFYHNDHDGEHFVWLRFSPSIVISCVVVWRRSGITGTSRGARLVCQFAGRGTSLKEKFAHSRFVLGVFVESSLLVTILQDSPGEFCDFARYSLFCEFVQDSFPIPGFQDRVRELQEETGGRSFSDESGGGKYFMLTILTTLIFLVFEFFLSVL